MTITLTAKQAKNLMRIMAWLLHNRNIDPTTHTEAREIYDALSSHNPHQSQE